MDASRRGVCVMRCTTDVPISVVGGWRGWLEADPITDAGRHATDTKRCQGNEHLAATHPPGQAGHRCEATPPACPQSLLHAP